MKFVRNSHPSLIAYLVGWGLILLVPLFFVALTRNKLPLVFGERWERLYHISGVFSGRVTRWRCNYIEMRFAGSKTWEDFRTDLYSGIYPSGGRNRLDRMLDDSSATHGAALRRRMAQHIVKKHRQLFPGSAAVEELRFVRVWFDAGSPALARPAGGWTYPPLPLVPPRDRKILSSHRFQKGRPVVAEPRFLAPVVFGDAELRALLEKGTRWDGLDLGGSQITAAILPLLVEKQPGLKHLSLRGTTYTDAWGSTLGKLSQLTSADLGQTKAGSGAANWLTGLKSLKTLRLDDTAIDSWMAGRLRGMPGLESLSLARTKIGGDLILDLTPWPKLRHLSLVGCPLKNGDLSRLKGGTVLESLDLGGTVVTDADVRSLRRLPRLRDLSLNGTSITAAVVADLRELPALEMLDLTGTPIPNAALEPLRGHRSLKQVRTGEGSVAFQPPKVDPRQRVVPLPKGQAVSPLTAPPPGASK